MSASLQDAAALCRELADELALIVDQVARELLPNGVKRSNLWRSGSVADDKGESLAVYLSGPRQGQWIDFAEPQGSFRAGGDMLELVAQVLFRGNKRDAIEWAKRRLGRIDEDPARMATRRAELIERRKSQDEQAKADAAKMRGRAQRLWLQAQPLNNSPAELYLATRGIDLSLLHALPGAIRFHPDCWNKEAGHGLPALVAAVVALDGTHIATHRIWIEPDGQGGARKHSRLAEPKKALGSFWGGHIPLNKGLQGCTLREVKPGTHLLTAEGIEDGLSVACAKPDERIVSAVSLGNIGAMLLPEAVNGVTIIGDRDLIAASRAQDIIDQVGAYRRARAADPRVEKPKGMSAAATLVDAIAHIQEGGRTVRLALPPVGVKDANLLATGGAVQGVAA